MALPVSSLMANPSDMTSRNGHTPVIREKVTHFRRRLLGELVAESDLVRRARCGGIVRPKRKVEGSLICVGTPLPAAWYVEKLEAVPDSSSPLHDHQDNNPRFGLAYRPASVGIPCKMICLPPE